MTPYSALSKQVWEVCCEVAETRIATANHIDQLWQRIGALAGHCGQARQNKTATAARSIYSRQVYSVYLVHAETLSARGTIFELLDGLTQALPTEEVPAQFVKADFLIQLCTRGHKHIT